MPSNPSTLPAVAVVGGGPIGASVARALAIRGKRVHWFEANRPLDGDFSRMAMSCPWAAGQVLAQSFEPDSLAECLGLRTREVLTELRVSGLAPVHRRPWLVCAPKGNTPLAIATRETLEAATRNGRMKNFPRLHGAALEQFPGLRAREIEYALCDEHALGVDPRALATALARWAAEAPGMFPHFGAHVTAIEGKTLIAHGDTGEIRAKVNGVVLCVGIHSATASPLLLDGLPLNERVPPATLTHLHVFDHRAAGHEPQILCSVAGPATIARYEVFGEGRDAITAHLPDFVHDFDINPLLTDVPGLCRLLDSHFATRAEAEAHTPAVRDAIAEMLEPFVESRLLPDHARGSRPITDSAIATYIKHQQPDGNPTLHWLDTLLPTLYVQPTNGRGVTQCIGLGEEAARRVNARLT